nr:8361_t:CDS:2 [Entrophospora candida]
MRYPDDIYFEHPQNVSVMTYRGHSVLRTLIRCHFGYFNFGGCRIFSRNLNWRMNFGGKLHDYLRLAPQENNAFVKFTISSFGVSTLLRGRPLPPVSNLAYSNGDISASISSLSSTIQINYLMDA